MTRRRFARGVAAMLLALPLGACATGSGDDVTAGDLPRMSLDRSLSSRTFTVVIDLGGRPVRVEGLVEDDYRYRATVALGDRVLYEEVVVDDARYLRVPDLASAVGTQAAAEAAAKHKAVAALARGEWVVDPAGAPVEFAGATRGSPTLFAAEDVLRYVRTLEDLPSDLGRGFREWDPDSLQYLPKDDKFPAHPQDGKRFDRMPAPYDPNAQTVAIAELRRFFEYMSVWAEPDGITRVERLLELPKKNDRKYAEVYRQIRQAGSAPLRALVDAMPQPRYAETYLFAPVTGDAARVVAPPTATPADLAPVLKLLAAQSGTAFPVSGLR